jgi:hypothetical protein
MNPRGRKRSDRGSGLKAEGAGCGPRKSDEGWTLWCKSVAIETRLPDTELIGDEDAVGSSH